MRARFWILSALLTTTFACDGKSSDDDDGTDATTMDADPAGTTSTATATATVGMTGTSATGMTGTGAATTGGTGDPTATGGDSGGSTGDPDPCVQLLAEFNQELTSIRSCTANEECGQVLTGTSCGCTRDLVARIDADISTFQQLVARGGELGCELPLGSTCDCPPADGFACQVGTCTWNLTGQ